MITLKIQLIFPWKNDVYDDGKIDIKNTVQN